MSATAGRGSKYQPLDRAPFPPIPGEKRSGTMARTNTIGSWTLCWGSGKPLLFAQRDPVYGRPVGLDQLLLRSKYLRLADKIEFINHN